MKLVYIVWIDAGSIDDWTPVAEAQEHSLHEIHSVGMIVKENDMQLTIALSHDKTADNVSQFLSVPKSWIKARKNLRVKLPPALDSVQQSPDEQP